jgi:hypothetical protein
VRKIEGGDSSPGSRDRDQQLGLSLKPRGIERLGDRAQSPVEFVLAHLQVRDRSARNEVSGHLLFCIRLPHTFMRWTTNYSAETNPNVVIRQAASYDQGCGGYPVTLLPCQGPTLRSMAANTAKRLHALTPRRTVLRLATLLSEFGYDLILKVTTMRA